ncbi:MAG: nucleotidyltransferase [Leptospiraceae bacterium]|nr:nucleotidyltransferase [Leptospiraceae bacterium]
MAKPTLLVLAAGMGSRYGSLKQLDGVGPHGETLMDYSIYDAIRAGFGKVVFVIRKSFAHDFTALFSASRFHDQIAVSHVFQELEMLPEPFLPPPQRSKPWGTNHAILVTRDAIAEPFAVINADDFYGRASFRVMADYLAQLGTTRGEYAMVGFALGKTLSEEGAVSRGVCTVDSSGYLSSVTERTHIARNGGTIYYQDENGNSVALADSTIVSMNLWGFTPDYFEHSARLFVEFLRKHISDPKAEFFIPLVVNRLVAERIARVRVLQSDAEWFGVTYPGDRPRVVEKIRSLIARGEYPEKLW